MEGQKNLLKCYIQLTKCYKEQIKTCRTEKGTTTYLKEIMPSHNIFLLLLLVSLVAFSQLYKKKTKITYKKDISFTISKEEGSSCSVSRESLRQ